MDCCSLLALKVVVHVCSGSKIRAKEHDESDSGCSLQQNPECQASWLQASFQMADESDVAEAERQDVEWMLFGLQLSK